MADVTKISGSSMTVLNALLVLACVFVSILALSSILSLDARGVPTHSPGFPSYPFSSFLYADRLKRAGLFAGRRLSSCTLFQCRSTRLAFVSKFYAKYSSKSPVLCSSEGMFMRCMSRAIKAHNL